ncbi:MAG: hypothetical protein A2X94_01230 [Bdellovibrionales bacterium GWB1_55_8]|nr:MAG: hypothetical protein A2X94_01230 [Bdellovibrionales bacterium GWB1_55_8]
MQLRLTKAVKLIAIICFAMFVIQQTADQFFGANLLRWFALVPSALMLDYRFWQVFTYAFLHGDVMHLFLNLMMLVFIGSEIEASWGTPRFLRFYFFCSISAGLFYLFLQLFMGGATLHTPMVGASGAIYGLLMAYGLLFGERVLLFMMLFPMKAKHFIWILVAVEFMSTVFSPRGGVAGAAHLGGMAAGFLYLWGWGRFLQIRSKPFGQGSSKKTVKKKRSADHLRLVKGAPNDPSDREDGPKTWH